MNIQSMKLLRYLALLSVIISLSILLLPRYAFAAYSDVNSELSASYKSTSSLSSSDLVDSKQKNYQGSGSGVNYLFETAEWTDKDNGEAKINIKASQDATAIEQEVSAVYFLNICLWHGQTVDIIRDDIKWLVDKYKKLDVIFYSGRSQQWQDAGWYMEWNFTPSNLYLMNTWEQSSPSITDTRTGKVFPALHESSSAAPAFRQYFFGDLNKTPCESNLVHNPYVVYTSSDGMITYGVSAEDAALSTDELWNFLADKYVPIGGQKRWFSTSAKYPVADGDGATNAQPASGTTAATFNPRKWGSSDVYSDFIYSQTFDSVGAEPIYPDFGFAGTISDDFEISSYEFKYKGETQTPTISGNSFQIDFKGYKGGEVSGTINLKLTDKGWKHSNEWINVNSTNIHSTTRSDTVASPKLAVTSDLYIEKTTSSTKTQSGEKVPYTITVTNKSKALAQESIVKDILPDGMIVSGTPTATKGEVSVSADKKMIEAKADNIGYNESYTISYEVEIEGGSFSSLTNTAIVSGNNQEERKVQSTIAVLKPQLSITKTSEQSSYQIDDTILYTVEVKNIAENTVAHNTVVSDVLPASIILQSDITSTQGTPTYNSSSNSWNLNIGELPYNNTVTIKYKAVVGKDATGAQYKNIAQAQADFTNPVKAECMVKIKTPKLSIEKVSIEETVQNDDPLHYDITIYNKGDGEARNLVITDMIPSAITLQPDDITMDHFAISDGKTNSSLTFNSAIENEKLTIKLNKALPAQTGIILHLASVVNHDAPPAIITNSASIIADNIKEISDTDNTVRVVAPILSIQKRALESIVQNDDEIHYNISVQNMGDGEARNVIITDAIPPQTTILLDKTSIDYYAIDGIPMSDPIDYNAQEIDSNYVVSLQKPLPVNTEIILHLSFVVNGDVEPCVISNTASVEADVFDRIEAVDNSIQVVAPKLFIVKRSNISSVQIGDTVPYEIIIQNLGEGQARNLIAEDDVPAEFALVPSSLKYQERDLVVIEDDRIKADLPEFDGGAIDDWDNEDNGWNNEENTDSDDNEDAVMGDFLMQSLNANIFDDVFGEGDLFAPTDEEGNENIEDGDEGNVNDDENNREEAVDGTFEEFNIEGNKWTLLLNHPLESQREIVITFDTTVNEIPSQTIKNVASTTADHVDFLSSEDLLIDTCDVEVLEPELQISKAVDKEYTQTDDILTYTITAQNTGNGEGRNYIIKDILPDFENLVGDISVNKEDAIVNIENREITISSSTIAPGEEIIIVYQASVSSGYDMGTQLVNHVDFSADYTEPVSAQASTLALIPGMNIVKTANVDEAMPGDNFIYIIEVIQNGEDDSVESNVVISDTLPEGISFNGSVSVNDNRTDEGIKDNSYSLSLPSMSKGEHIKIVIPVISDTSVEGKTITNTASVYSNDTDEITSSAEVKFGTIPETPPIIPDAPIIEKPQPTPQAIPQLPKTGEQILLSGIIIVIVGLSIAFSVSVIRKRKNSHTNR